MVTGPTGTLACSEYGTWSCTDRPCGDRGHGVTVSPHSPSTQALAQLSARTHPFMRAQGGDLGNHSRPETWGASPSLAPHGATAENLQAPHPRSGHCDLVLFEENGTSSLGAKPTPQPPTTPPAPAWRPVGEAKGADCPRPGLSMGWLL